MLGNIKSRLFAKFFQYGGFFLFHCIDLTHVKGKGLIVFRKKRLNFFDGMMIRGF
jgi:hypothetical protein